MKRLENEHVTLADVVGKPLDVRSKSIDQWFVAACLSLLNIVEQIALPETAPPPVAKPPTAILRFLFPRHRRHGRRLDLAQTLSPSFWQHVGGSLIPG